MGVKWAVRPVLCGGPVLLCGCCVGGRAAPRFLLRMVTEVKQVSFVMSAPPNEGGCVVGAPDKVGFMSSVRGWTSVSCCCLFFFFFFLSFKREVIGRTAPQAPWVLLWQA